SVVFIIQGMTYITNSSLFINLFEFKDSIANTLFREGKLRLTYPSTLISFSIVISFSEALSNKKNGWTLIYYLNAVFGLIYLIFVCQTRVLLISILISLFGILIFKSHSDVRKKIVYTLLICCALTLFMNTSFVKDFFESFNDTQYAGSVYARREAIEYYVGKVKTNPINGMGMLYDDPNSNLYYVLHGPQGYLYTTDVGIVGLASILGLFGLLWYIALIFKLFRMTFIYNKFKKFEVSINNIGILIFLCATSFTLIVTDPQRILLLPLIMIVIEYNYRNLIKIVS
ncbi:hypothetical protein HGI79_22260, partial [Clostridium sp. DJ247]|nr:hypothetical protein [Clostridium sp. DJ247]